MSIETRRPNMSLAMRAWNIRRKALLMAEVQGQGYIGQALGVADVLATAYFHAVDFRPEDPEWEGRDRFYLSIGHYAIALYATLMEAGVLPEDELTTYGMDDSRMPMSGMASYTPGMEITGGSLLAGPGFGHRGRRLPGAETQGQSGLCLQPDVGWRAGRRVHMGSGDVRRAMEARQPDLRGRFQQPTG